MKYLQVILIFTLTLYFNIDAEARQLTVSSVSEHASNSQSQYPLDGGIMESDRGSYSIGENDIYNPKSWSVSYYREKAAFLETRGREVILSMFETSGKKLTEKELEFFDSQDETLKVYLFDDGQMATRDNVANFTFFDVTGDQLYSVSNSSQSSEGERESELAADSNGNTIVLYNPVINYGNSRGSQARLVYGEEDHEVFFRDQSAEIIQLKVSESGSYISILTSTGSGYQLHLYDRFGNKLKEHSFDDEQKGVSLSEDAKYVTVYSGGRTQVLDVLSGDRVGSTSSRSPVIYSRYMEDDDVILVFGGRLQGNQIDDPTISAIHVGARQILRENIDESLSIYDMERLSITRLQSNSYQIEGLNRSLRVQAGF